MDQTYPHWAVRDLHFAYTRRAPELFGGLTHAFAPGQVTALTGQSGRGKSTLLYLLGLLLRPRSGQILIDDADAARSSDARASRLRAGDIGFVFQDAQLDPRATLVDCVAEPGTYLGDSLAAWRPRAQQLLTELGLAAASHQRAGKVSGGQAQRAAVCRALLTSPGLLLADEPTGNLDRANAELVLAALQNAARQGRTVVIATHDPFVVSHAQVVLDL